MKQGSKVELPLWLGEMLALRYLANRRHVKLADKCIDIETARV